MSCKYILFLSLIKNTISLPVFGTEEALVEPMLFALETRLLVNAVSVKKPASESDECQGDIVLKHTMLDII